jgi:cardiolipin synthase
MEDWKRLAITLGALLVATFALIGVLSVTRGTPVHRVVALNMRHAGPPPVTDSLFARSIELFTVTHLDDGNAVELVNNGRVYERLWRDLAAARQTITVQMYYSQPGHVADTLAKYLAERAHAGVRVLLLLDAFGSQNLIGAWTDRLRRAGVEVALLRQLHWYTIHNAADRSHVRVVVIDGRVGYTGGFGLADYWLGDGHHEDQWRESNVRFEGPAVMELQAAFAAAWAEATGELLVGDVFFPRASFLPHGPVRAGLLFTMPTTGSTPAERFLALSIASARRTLYVSNSYFVPDDDFRALLLAAARRGVDVRVLTVGRKTDVKTTWYAGRYRYEELLRGGVRIYEYQPTMMHAKTLVVDGTWASVGSMNADNRSLSFNEESTFLALDAGFGRDLEALFHEDLRHSTEIVLDEFRRRPWYSRTIEFGAMLLSRLL